MKPTLVIALLLAAGTVPALAADPHAGHHAGAHGTAGVGAAAPTDGVVKKIDRAGGKLTVAHGPIANLNMPAMTMAFRVKDPAWLGKLKEGTRIRFLVENIDGAFTITRIDAD